MENASQALFIAAGVLIAVMIISLGVFLFSTASSIGESYELTMSATEIQKFNSQFTEYEKQILYINRLGAKTSENMSTYSSSTYIDGKSNYITDFNTISDVVSAINKAYNINEKNNCDQQTGIQVNIKNLKYANYNDKDYGITPIYQKEFSKNKSDKNCIYELKDYKANEKINKIDNINSLTKIELNELLQKLSESKTVEGLNEDELIIAYKYVFKGKTILNKETGLIDILEFECIPNPCYDLE